MTGVEVMPTSGNISAHEMFPPGVIAPAFPRATFQSACDALGSSASNA
jgi:hypothetical protein